MANFLNLRDIKVKEETITNNFGEEEIEVEKYGFLPAGAWYKVEGELTPEDINNINQINKETYLVFDNTKGLSVDILNQINNHNIKFSIVGGYDYINKNKFMKDMYAKRTLVDKEYLIKIIEYFERIESHIDKNWNETQKCMFLYDSIVKDFIYKEDYPTAFKDKDPARGLNGILYKKLVCAGFSQVFKEGLDRLGIENYYQNKQGKHDWNIVKLDGQITGMDITWDCYNKGKYNINTYNWFGRGNDFYDNPSHQNSSDKEELQFDLVAISPEMLRTHLEIIKPVLESRGFENLPILEIEQFRDKAEKEVPYLIAVEYLKEQNLLTEEELLLYNSVYSRRRAIVSDVLLNNKQSIIGGEIGLPEYDELQFHSGGQISTPSGVENPRLRAYDLTPEYRAEINNKIKEKMKAYYQVFLKSCIKDLENDVSKYIELSKIERTEAQSVIYSNIYSKLNILLESKDILIKMGVDNNLVNNLETLIGKALNVDDMSEEQIKENQIKNDIDFLYGILADYDGLRNIAEQYYGKNFTDEEWLENYQSSAFMRETFNEGLSQYNITDEQLQEILNNIVEEKGLSKRNYI